MKKALSIIVVLILLGVGVFSFWEGSKIDVPKNQSQIANPASLNCKNVGGTLSIEKKGDGSEYGLCFFEDNRACEEWALFRGDCPVGGMRTTGYDTVDQKFCAWAGGQTYAVENSICIFKDGTKCPTIDFYNGTCVPQTPVTTATSSPVACTMDAKQCSDGSYVGRTGPNCEFKCPQSNLWNGKYSYENKYTIFSLTIDGEKASIIDDGYQTEIRFNATTKEVGDKLEIIFDSYGPEDMFKNGYKKGDLLFTISKDKEKYITTWGKFEGLSDNKIDEFKKVE
jgi:putative hemolysin